MRLGFAALLIAGLLLAGCGAESTTQTPAGGQAPVAGSPSPGPGPAGLGEPSAGPRGSGLGGPGAKSPGARVERAIPAAAKPVPVNQGIVTLTPENSKIEFIGTTAVAGGPSDSQIGGFEKF